MFQNYQSHDLSNAFSFTFDVHKPNDEGIDAPIIYAGYHYIEALLQFVIKKP